jgi:hypothetical protein
MGDSSGLTLPSTSRSNRRRCPLFEYAPRLKAGVDEQVIVDRVLGVLIKRMVG